MHMLPTLHLCIMYSQSALLTVCDHTTSHCNNSINIKGVTAAEVEEVLKKLKSNKTLGPDTTSIPPYVFKNCRKLLADPICHISNLSLKEGIFPNDWKISRITPIPKTSNCMEISDYRPISVLKVPAKVYETLIHQKLFWQLKNQISTCQSGFYEGRSVVTNLLIFVYEIGQTLDKELQMDVMYTDF